MALPIPDGYAEIGIEFARTGLTPVQVITFGVKLKAAPTDVGIALDIKNAWTFAGSLNGAQPATVEANVVRHRSKYGGVDYSGQSASGWVHGGGATALASPAVALACKKSTGVAGRKNRGRFFLPWVGEGDVDAAGTVLAATVTGYNAALAIFLAQLAAAGRTYVNGMYILHADGSAPRAVTTLVARNKVGTVRRRQPVV